MLCVGLTKARDYHITQTNMEPVNSSKRTLSSLRFHWAKKKNVAVRLSVCPVQARRRPEPRTFLSRTPAAREAVLSRTS